MAQVVIKNSDNKVIRNTSGNILRQNFQFGYGIKNHSGNAGIRFNLNLILSGTYTFLFWFKPTLNVIGQFPTVLSFTSASPYYVFLNGTTVNFSTFCQSASAVTALPYSVGTQQLIGLEIKDQKARFRQGTYIEPDLGRTFPSILSYFQLLMNLSGGFQGRSSTFLAFNRILSSAEINYLNSINEPSSNQGLISQVQMSNAEILDFSALQNGSDMRVGCRDISGANAHGEFIGLPAGTNAEKLIFANANYFNTTW